MAPLPTLTGTDKQVSWASDIRARVVDALDALRRQIAQSAANKPGQDHLAAAVNATIDEHLAQHAEAKWWIDNQHTAYTLIKKAAADAARASQPTA